MRNSLLVTVLGLAFGLSACNSAVNNTADAVQTDSVDKAIGAESRGKMIAHAYESYLVLKDKLVKSNVAEIKVAATKLETDLSMVEGCEEAVSLAHQISNVDLIKDQRASFVNLSHDMITMVKNDTPAGEKIFVQFCPMANAGKGAYWLSGKEAIENPYYGDEMLDCGTVKETLN